MSVLTGKFQNLCLILILSCSTFAVSAQEKVIPTKSTINKVTVFVNGAQIERKASVQIPQGMSTILFDNLATGINPNSLQASGTGKFVITDIQYRYVHPEPNEQVTIPGNILRQIEHLEDSVGYISLKLEAMNNQMNVLAREELFILNHPISNGKGKPDSLELMIATSDFLRDRLRDLTIRKYTLKKELTAVNKHFQKVQQQLQDLRNYNNNQPAPLPNKPRHQVLVQVVADAPVYGVVEAKYFTNAASWIPAYDLHATAIGKNLRLTYKAIVQQYTGVDWEGVRLKISNANPNRNQSKPVLPVWYIGYYQEHVVKAMQRTTAHFIPSTESKVEDVQEMADDTEVQADIASNYTQKVVNFSSVEFDIDLPYRISSDNRAHYVVLKEEEIATSYEHHLIPKMDLTAFVVGKLTDWRNLDLLIGRANIFFGGTFVGHTVIDPTILSDTMLVSLGPDERVRSERKLLSSSTKEKVLSSKKVYSASYQIEVKNTHATAINLIVLDQIPKTTEKDIAIAVTDMGGAELLEDAGHLRWKRSTRGGQAEKFGYTYIVEYPEDQRITGL